MNGVIFEHICVQIRKHNVSSIKDERAWDRMYDILFLNQVETSQCSHSQAMWRYCRSRNLPFLEWWDGFHSFMGQMGFTTPNQIKNWWWENPHVCRDQFDRSNLLTTSSWKVKYTAEQFSLYCSHVLRVLIEAPSCWQYNPCELYGH